MARLPSYRKVRAVLDSTGLAYGDASKIARIHQVTPQHVIEVAAGRRPGRPPLVRTIARYRAKHQEAAALLPTSKEAA